jgi:quercetin dioxygenase-like cupin family protein
VTTAKRTPYTQILLVLGVGILIGALGQDALSASRPRTKVTTLKTQDLKSIDGKAVQIITLDVDPLGDAPVHKHPGDVFGYVISGEYEVGIDEDPAKVFKAGEIFYEPDGVVHRVGRNPDKKTPAKVVVFMLLDEGKPATMLHRH